MRFELKSCQDTRPISISDKHDKVRAERSPANVLFSGGAVAAARSKS